MSSSERGDLPLPAVPPRDGPPEASLTLGRPGHYVEFNTPPEPASQPVGAFPAVAPPQRRRPPPRRPPRRRARRVRIVVSVPNWVLGGLAILAAVAGLLFIPTLSPWARAPAESPLGSADPGVGVVGTGNPGGSDPADPGAGPDATGNPMAPGGSGATSGPAATPTTTGPDGAATTASVPVPQLTGFATRPLAGGLIGYEIDLSVTNSASVAQTWSNASAYISGVPLVVTVVEPTTGVRAVLASGRVCLEPTDTATRNLDPDESQRVMVQLTMVSLGQAPRQGTLDDGQCPASAES